MVFGIGNPLIDVVIPATDKDLTALDLDKGIMHLVDEDRQKEILHHFSEATPTYRPGGSAPNTMLACGGMGIEAVISGKIGDDELGRTYEKQVADYGITSRLSRGTGATGSSIILITPDGERTMNTHLGMCREYGKADVDEELLRRSSFLYFTGYMWDTDIQKGAIQHAVGIARESGIKVVFDVADPFAVGRYHDDFLELLKRDVDIVFANRTEARILFGIDGETLPEESDELARRLGELVTVTALKTGKDGSIVVSNGETHTISGRSVTPLDTTGAGDMYAAGFLVALELGRSPTDAARLAGRLAEEIILETGAQFSVDRIRKLREELLVRGGL